MCKEEEEIRRNNSAMLGGEIQFFNSIQFINVLLALGTWHVQKLKLKARIHKTYLPACERGEGTLQWQIV